MKHYTEATIERALAEIREGKSINSVSIKYGISRTLINNRLKEREGGETVKKRGRNTVFEKDVEKQIAEAVKTMAEAGFGPTIQKLQAKPMTLLLPL